jgi:ribosomal protein S18 acetylase RimI-like enzyme
MKIINLPEDRWAEFKDLRIRGLTEENMSFARTPLEESKRTEQEWRDRCNNRLETNYREWLLAEDGDKLIGCVMIAQGEPQKVRHVGHIAGMFVTTEYRKMGVATALLSEGLSRLKANGATKVRLEVISNQDPAVNLYKKLGLETVGTFKKEVYTGDGYLDEFVMEKFF